MLLSERVSILGQMQPLQPLQPKPSHNHIAIPSLGQLLPKAIAAEDVEGSEGLQTEVMAMTAMTMTMTTVA